MGVRRTRLDLRQHDQRVSRKVNGQVKTLERARRQTRMIGLIQAGKFPYTPPVRSWLSATLAKPSTQITEAEVNDLVARLTVPVS